VLLGDSDVEHPLRVALGEPVQPDGMSIAAVIPTTSGRRSPRCSISSANTEVQL